MYFSPNASDFLDVVAICKHNQGIVVNPGNPEKVCRMSNPLTTGTVWGRLLELGVESLIVWIALLAVMLCVAAYVIQRVRAQAVQKEHSAGELLSNFREMHSRGVLDDSEYRTIKTVLTARLSEELKDNDQKG